VRIKSQKDFFAGLIFAGAGLAFAWGASEHAIGHLMGDGDSLGPGYLPLLLGSALALIGALLVLRALVMETADGHPAGTLAWRALGGIAGACFLFGALLGGLPALGLPPMGLLAASCALVIVAALAGGKLHWPQTLLMAAILSAASWAVLVWWLQLPMQTWPRFPG